jgi:hypothetical protein
MCPHLGRVEPAADATVAHRLVTDPEASLTTARTVAS